MRLLYEREGMKSASGSFETVGAADAGQAVGRELARR
jgi:hypothetical protein